MAHSSSPLEGKRAAIVEDEGITVMQLRRALMQAGMQVVGSALNAQEGINLVLDKRPDLVLMDITMPGELDGLDAAEAILARFPVCIVMVTAYSNEEYQRRASDIPTCGYLIKPVTAQTLIPALEKAYANWSVAPP